MDDNPVMPTDKPKRAPRFSGGSIVLAVALAMQLVYLIDGRDDPTFNTPIVDAATYHEAAARVANGEGLLDDAFWQPPLFPLLLGLIYRLFGVNVLIARIAMASLAGASCLLVWRLGRRLYGDSTGFVAGLMAGACGPFLFFSTQLLPVGLGVFLDLAALNVWLDARERGRLRTWGLFGLICGLAIITIPNAVVIPLIAVFALSCSAVRGPAARRALLGCLAIITAASVPIGAVTLRNYLVTGEWVIISTNAGINFHIGNNPERDRTVAIRPGEPWRRLNRESYAGGARTRAQQSDYFLRRGMSYIKDRPGDFFRGLGDKALQLINGREIPRNVDPYIHRDYSPTLSVLLWRAGPFAFPFGLLAPLAIWGLVRTTSRPLNVAQLRDRRVIRAAILAYAASVILFFVTSRYRIPLTIMLMPFAAAAAVDVARRLRGKTGESSGTRGLAVPALVAISVVLANLPLDLPTDRVNFRAELAMCVGHARVTAGRQAEGEELFRRALALNEHYAEAAVRWAGLMAERGEYQEAESLLQRVRTEDDQSAELRLLYGRLVLEQGRTAEALTLFKEAVAIDPTAPAARLTLAEQLVATDLIEAVEQFTHAADLAEKPGPILIRLGDLLVEAGRCGEGIESYRRGLWLIEPDAQTLGRVARVLATCPQPELHACDPAIDMAQQAVKMTGAEDETALSTLATVLGKCGRTSEAVGWARRAAELARSRGDDVTSEKYRRQAEHLQKRLPAASSPAPDPLGGAIPRP